ncbi:MAG: flagellar biosynthesis protein FlhF [Bacillota bacterium]
MIVKRYLASSMPQAMEQIRKDLGSEAVILSTRMVPDSSWRRFFGLKQLEVTAALEEIHSTKNQSSELGKEIKELGKMVQEFKNSSHKPVAGQVPSKGWLMLMQQLGITPVLAEKLIEGLGEPGGGRERELLIAQIKSFLEGRTGRKENRIHCFVGPTGVGKTTTLAKLATQAAIFREKDVLMITTDTYRIGAVEQLKTYAEILNTDLEVVLTPEELIEVLEKYQDKEAIFVDTTGRPSYNREQLVELKYLLGMIPYKTVSLVLSCSTKDEDLVQIAEDFSLIGYDQIIFTKTDETTTLGSILNLLYKTGRPVAYLTTGQNVPDDILVADSEKVAKLVLGAKE